MLADKDRIFKNLYGQGDWGLDGARARGAWNGTKAILKPSTRSSGSPPTPNTLL